MVEGEKAATFTTTEMPAVPVGAPGRTPIRDPRTLEVHQRLAEPRPGEVAVTEETIAAQVDPSHLGLTRLPEPQDGRVVAYAWEMNLDDVATDPNLTRVTRIPVPSRLTLRSGQYVEEMRASSPGWHAYWIGFSRDVFGSDIYNPIVTEAKKMTTFVRLWTDRLIGTLKRHGATSKEARVRIGMILDGQDVPNATAAERAAAAEIRRKFYGEAPGKALHGEFGIPAEMWLNNYLPRYRNPRTPDMEALLQRYGAATPQELPADIRLQYEEMRRQYLDQLIAQIEPRYRNFFAEFHRFSDLPAEEYDVLETSLRYLRAGAKKKFLDPVLEQVEPLAAQMHPDRQQLFRMMVNNVFGRPEVQERLINATLNKLAGPIYRALKLQFPDRPAQELSRFFALATHSGTLAFNIHSALQNWTQRFHAAFLTSPADYLWAERARRTETGKFLLRYNEALQHRLWLEGMELEQKIIDRTLGRFLEAGMFLFQRVDLGNVETSYLAGVRYALRQGKSWAEAIEYGNYIAKTTQFEYGLNQPAFLRTPLGRVLGALQSYPLHMARLLYEQATGEQTRRSAALVAGMAGVKYPAETVTGLQADRPA